MAVEGAGAAGCPTSIWMTCPPAASIRAAAAITSITMNGGTLLRADGVTRCLAISSIEAVLQRMSGESLDLIRSRHPFADKNMRHSKNLAPLSPHSPALGINPLGIPKGIPNSFGALALTGAAHVPRLPPRERGWCPA